MEDIIGLSRAYIDKIVSHKALRKDSNIGKALILDSYTTQVVANVYSQTQVLEKEFYLVEQLGAVHEPMPHLKAAIFVRPSAENVTLLVRELSSPRFKEYHIFFSNVLSRGLLRRLADADENELVKQVHEYFGDFIPVNEDLFTLNLPGSLRLSCSEATESAPLFSQSVEGILSMLLSLKVEPSQIRYQGSSEVSAEGGITFRDVTLFPLTKCPMLRLPTGLPLRSKGMSRPTVFSILRGRRVRWCWCWIEWMTRSRRSFRSGLTRPWFTNSWA